MPQFQRSLLPLERVSLVMDWDSVTNPLHTGLLCAMGIVLHSDLVTDLFQLFLGSKFRLHWVAHQQR